VIEYHNASSNQVSNAKKARPSLDSQTIANNDTEQALMLFNQQTFKPVTLVVAEQPARKTQPVIKAESVYENNNTISEKTFK